MLEMLWTVVPVVFLMVGLVHGLCVLWACGSVTVMEGVGLVGQGGLGGEAEGSGLAGQVSGGGCDAGRVCRIVGHQW